jgi:hypothetical protein
LYEDSTKIMKDWLGRAVTVLGDYGKTVVKHVKEVTPNDKKFIDKVKDLFKRK